MATIAGKFRHMPWLHRFIVGAVVVLLVGLSFGVYGEVYGASVPVPSMSVARSQHTATLLPDGRVLVVGGNPAVTTTEIYDPATNEWQAVDNMSIARIGHSATLLSNGQVLVVGSEAPLFPPPTSIPTELYDPAIDRWTRVNEPKLLRNGQTATLLADGTVLVAGGSGPLTTAEQYTPATGVWSDAGNMRMVRRQATATRLPDGRVLVVGGQFVRAMAEIYDPVRRSWQGAGTPSYAWSGHTATLLVDGRVLVAGGFGSSGTAYPSPSSLLPVQTELYSPTINTWTLGPTLNVMRQGHTSTLLPDGRVLVVGGYTGFRRFSATVEVYDPARNQWFFAQSLTTARANHTATLLADGTVLIAGGEGADGLLTSAERYDPRVGVLDVRHYLPWTNIGRENPPVFPTFGPITPIPLVD
jgi:hypothetical protein